MVGCERGDSGGGVAGFIGDADRLLQRLRKLSLLCPECADITSSLGSDVTELLDVIALLTRLS